VESRDTTSLLGDFRCSVVSQILPAVSKTKGVEENTTKQEADMGAEHRLV